MSSFYGNAGGGSDINNDSTIIRGKNATISNIEAIPGGNRVTFRWTLDDGTPKTRTMDVMNGEDGSTYIPEVGSVVTLSSDAQATASVSIDPETGKATFNFGIPRGQNGEGGDSNSLGSVYSGILNASNWNLSTKQQTITFIDYDASTNGLIGVPSSATAVQKEVFFNNGISVVSKSGSSVTFQAKTIPDIDIPIRIYCGTNFGIGGIPNGGTAGQVLVKNSDDNGDASWEDPTGGDSSLTANIISNIAVGAIAKGITLSRNTTFTDFVRKLLIAEIAPEISLSLSDVPYSGGSSSGGGNEPGGTEPSTGSGNEGESTNPSTGGGSEGGNTSGNEGGSTDPSTGGSISGGGSEGSGTEGGNTSSSGTEPSVDDNEGGNTSGGTSSTTPTATAKVKNTTITITGTPQMSTTLPTISGEVVGMKISDLFNSFNIVNSTSSQQYCQPEEDKYIILANGDKISSNGSIPANNTILSAGEYSMGRRTTSSGNELTVFGGNLGKLVRFDYSTYKFEWGGDSSTTSSNSGSGWNNQVSGDTIVTIICKEGIDPTFTITITETPQMSTSFPVEPGQAVGMTLSNLYTAWRNKSNTDIAATSYNNGTYIILANGDKISSNSSIPANNTILSAGEYSIGRRTSNSGNEPAVFGGALQNVQSGYGMTSFNWYTNDCCSYISTSDRGWGKIPNGNTIVTVIRRP